MSQSTADLFSQLFSTFKDATSSQEVPLKAAIISLILWGVKEFLNKIVFECPNKHHAAYGNFFIYGPAVILFCLSMLISDSFWHFMTGCCRLSSRQRRIIFWKSRKSIYLAVIPPMLWLVLAFVQEKYYVCYKLGPLKFSLAKANGTKEEEEIKLTFSDAEAESVVIAWSLFLSLAMLSTIVVSIHRFCAKIDPKFHDSHVYDKLESNEVVRLFNDRIKQLAKDGAQKVMGDLEAEFKDKAPYEAVKTGVKILEKVYPKAGGVFHGEFKSHGKGTEIGARVSKGDKKVSSGSMMHLTETNANADEPQ